MAIAVVAKRLLVLNKLKGKLICDLCKIFPIESVLNHTD